MKKPTISQYLLSTCLFTIDELNEQYRGLSKEELKQIADDKYNEMDITVRLGYPFKQAVHYTVGDGKKNGSKVNHDLYVESKDFKIEINKLVTYLGGKDNIITYEFNKSRFIVTLADVSLANKEAIQRMGAQGIVEIDNQLKIILGDEAKQLKKQINELMR